jgi:sterol desaturase/sphingolipid hydroxylase (fatty acid hydroxylase superfamily)
MHRQYWFWLAIVSFLIFALERAVPWRREQEVLRPQLGQDIFWLVFNGYGWGLLISSIVATVPADSGRTLKAVLNEFTGAFAFLHSMPLLIQAFIYLVIADMIEYAVHNALHRLGWLWPIHRLHHSLHTMDWIGNFRFHWGELIVYGSIKFLPLALLGARYDAMLIAWVTSTAIGHLNHSNLNISWGPLRYVLNSPRMHIWHHDKHPDNRVGYNFAVVFSLWDWLFGTAHMPNNRMPDALGFARDESYPDSLVIRFVAPYLSTKRRAVSTS